MGWTRGIRRRAASQVAAVALVVAAIVAATLVGPAAAGKFGRSAVVKDPKDGTGSIYTKDIYKSCDLTEVKAQVKRKTLLVKSTTAGKRESPQIQLNLNTKGSKKSAPEYRIDPFGGITSLKKGSFEADAAKVKIKDGGKSLQHKIPLKEIGKPKKTGFQAQTCGEAAVDIAPGTNYFDDTGFDGTVENKYKGIRTGR